MTLKISNLNIDVEPELEAKAERLVAVINSLESVLVAYSGGVDSALVLKVAHEVLGPELAAGCLAISPSVPPREVELAKKHAGEMGVRLLLTHTKEIEKEGYVENSPNRCYYCKSTLYTELTEMAQAQGFTYIADGFNL